MNTQLLTLSRLQFAFTVAFHMTFPAITVGLSVFLVLLYGAYLRTNKEIYLTIYRFWRNLFAVAFGLGVVSGIVLTFEFGLNWAGYANAVGPIVGVTNSMEVITAFFQEAGFIGILLYGTPNLVNIALRFQGGERRRLSIARALLTSPSVLLLDEPTVGVDGALARQMLSSIRALLPESTCVVATHDAWLLALAEQNIRLPAGKRAAW